MWQKVEVAGAWGWSDGKDILTVTHRHGYDVALNNNIKSTRKTLNDAMQIVNKYMNQKV